MVRAPAAEPTFVKACCADLWSHPGVRMLAGESLHPGGLDLTERALAGLALDPGARVLDLGCGPGTTAELMCRRELRVVGLDYSRDLAAEAAARAPAAGFAVADAERLPFADASFDGLLAECVLSVLPDLEGAAGETARVLRPGGRIAVSDVVREAPLPEELDTLVSWIACAAGALPSEQYGDLLVTAGFRGLEVEDHSGALASMINRARRRLGLLQGSVAAGLVDPGGAGLDPGLIVLGQTLLGMAAGAVESGHLGYALLIATRG